LERAQIDPTGGQSVHCGPPRDRHPGQPEPRAHRVHAGPVGAAAGHHTGAGAARQPQGDPRRLQEARVPAAAARGAAGGRADQQRLGLPARQSHRLPRPQVRQRAGVALSRGQGLCGQAQSRPLEQLAAESVHGSAGESPLQHK